MNGTNKKRLSWAVNSSIGGKNTAFAQGKYVNSTVAKDFVCSKIKSHIHLYLNTRKRLKKSFFPLSLTAYFYQVLVY